MSAVSVGLSVALIVGLHATGAAAQTTTFPPFPAVPSTLGAIPDGPGPGCGNAGSPRDVNFASPAAAGLASVSVTMTLSHPSIGHLSATLIAPDGTAHVLFGRPGALAAGDCGSTADAAGPYGFDDAGTPFWPATATTGTVPSGVYRTSTAGGVASGGTTTVMTTVFSGRNAGGVWRLRLTDSGAGDAGSVLAAALSVTYPRVIPAADDAYTASAGVPLVVPAPGVLANDGPAGSLTMWDQLFRTPLHGTLTTASDGGFSYTPDPSFVGTDLFAYYALGSAGVSRETAVTITVTASQSPTQFEVASLVNGRVLLRWQAPGGPTPFNYQLSWGVLPGVPLGHVLLPPTPTALGVDMAPGVYYVRLRALGAAGLSAPSPEIAVNVGTPALPSAPTGLMAGVNGSTVTLHWRTTYLGGVPTAARVDVAGAVTGSVSVVGESLQVPAVPPGTYTVSVRSTNAIGVSPSSAPVTITVPGACSPPLPPLRFVAFSSPGRLAAAWDAAPSGGAPDRYEVELSNAVSATVPVGLQRVHDVPAPAGVYGLRVRAGNACGSSAFTPVQAVVVP